MDCSTPGLPIHHQLPEFTQTHVHRYSFRSCPSQCCCNANLELLDFWFQHQVVSQAAVSRPELNVGSPDENQESLLPDQQGPEARSKGTLGLSSAWKQESLKEANPVKTDTKVTIRDKAECLGKHTEKQFIYLRQRLSTTHRVSSAGVLGESPVRGDLHHSHRTPFWAFVYIWKKHISYNTTSRWNLNMDTSELLTKQKQHHRLTKIYSSPKWNVWGRKKLAGWE